MRIQMTNEDGSPFYANLTAESTVKVSIGEAYTLAASLRETAETLRQFSITDAATDLHRQMSQTAADLLLRAEAIEVTLDHDKYEQWAAVAPAWAIRAI